MGRGDYEERGVDMTSCPNCMELYPSAGLDANGQAKELQPTCSCGVGAVDEPMEARTDNAMVKWYVSKNPSRVNKNNRAKGRRT